MALGSSLYGYANSVMLLRNDRSGGFSGPAVISDLSGAVGTSALTTGYFITTASWILRLPVQRIVCSRFCSILIQPLAIFLPYTPPNWAAPSSIAAGDIDSDGDTDLVLANDYDNTISILKR